MDPIAGNNRIHSYSSSLNENRKERETVKRLIVPVFFFMVGLVYLIASFNLPKAKLGDPHGPLYFPAIVCVILTVLSVVYFFQELKKRNIEFKEFKVFLEGRTRFLIASTLVLIFVYTFLFERIGFLYSTIVFLSGLLFVINGKQKWKANIVIAVSFSFISWYTFAVLLQVSLP
jgi:putative tricarboxylic transport membrane protein